jgi:ABC-type branched-subunit amino acid transport system substrate-binding protein
VSKVQTIQLIAIISIIAIVFGSGCTGPEEEKVKIGTLLPITGDLAQFGGPMQNAAKLAIEEVNENGGLLGTEVSLINTDSQTSEIAAVEAANKLVSLNKVPAVIGAAGSGVSMAIIDVTTGNNVVQISPSNTGPDFTTYNDSDFYFRTCPSDALQGRAMATLATLENYTTASTFVINNAYGVGFEKVFVEEFEKMGGQILNRVKYDPQAAIFDSEISKASEHDPDVIILVSYPETGSAILKAAYEKGIMEKSDWLLSEGLKDDALAGLVGKDPQGKFIIAGIKGTAPDPRKAGPAYETFKEAFVNAYGEDPTTFSSNTYDAAAVIALAIEKAGRADGIAIRDNIRAVANPPGEDVTDIGRALELIREGKDINYQGASGDITFDKNGDITTAYYAQWYIDTNGSVVWGEAIDIS